MIKLFQVRDDGTNISVLATSLTIIEPSKILRRAGLPSNGVATILINLATMEAKSHFENWSPGRTMKIAHKYIHENWNWLDSDRVIDVQYLLGETTETKEME